MTRLIKYTSITIILSLFLAACTTDVDDKFDDSAANRITKAIKEYKEILVAAENGWLMEYYAEGNGKDKMGGVSIVMKFDSDGNVTMSSDYDTYNHEISSEKAPAGTKIESEYDVIADQIIMLTFHSYNPILHYYTEPHGSSDVNGYEGDYEFLFREVSKDEIIFSGKKYGLKIRMTPIQSGVDTDALLKKMTDIRKEASFNKYELLVAGERKGEVTINNSYLNLFTIKIFQKETTFKENAIYTTNGIKFTNPITIEGETISSMTWNSESRSFISDNTKQQILFRQDYQDYSYFIGDYTLSYKYGTRDITILENIKDVSYKVKGMFEGLEPIFTYNKSMGRMEFKGHLVKPISSNYIALLPWDSNAGTFYNSSTIGANFISDLSANNKFDLRDNGMAGANICEALLLWELTPNWATVGAYTAINPNRLASPISIIKK